MQHCISPIHKIEPGFPSCISDRDRQSCFESVAVMVNQKDVCMAAHDSAGAQSLGGWHDPCGVMGAIPAEGAAALAPVPKMQ
jgi:hypothetical protein